MAETATTSPDPPNRRTRLLYWLLIQVFNYLRWRRERAYQRYRAWDARIGIVGRPISILGARHMKELVNGD